MGNEDLGGSAAGDLEGLREFGSERNEEYSRLFMGEFEEEDDDEKGEPGPRGSKVAPVVQIPEGFFTGSISDKTRRVEVIFQTDEDMCISSCFFLLI